MKILMLSSYLPYPLYSGGHVRLYNLIRELGNQHEITLICEKRPYQTHEDIEEIEKICKKVITVPRRPQWSVQNIINSAVSPHSFLQTGHTSEEMQQKIERELQRNRFDLIHVETYYVMQNLPNDDKLPIVLAEHNIEYQIYQKFVDSAPILFRPLLSLDIAKIKKEEEAFWKQAKRVVVVSEEDKKIVEQKGVSPTIVANGVDIDKFIFTDRVQNFEKDEKRILFLGDFKWIQNRDSVTFILKDILLEIKKLLQRDSGQARMTDIKLWIVGRKIPDSIRSLTTDSSVLFDEDSSSLPTERIFQQADVLLSPIRVGGGTSYKILEAMASGTPVVTMPMSAQSIHAKEEHDIMVGNSAKELAEKTVQLLQDKKLYEKISKNGRKLIEEKYTWKEIAKELEKVYKKVKHG